MSEPSTPHRITHANRYRVIGRRFRWTIVAGTGTRSLGRFVRWKTAQRMAEELQTAFYDGRWVGQTEDAP